MRHAVNIFFIFFLLFYINQQQFSQEYTLVKGEDTNIQIDFETGIYVSRIIEDDRNYYFLDRKNNPHIAVIDKSSLTQIDNIYFESEGPSAINNPFDLVIINNQLGVYEFYSKEIKLIDKQGDIIQSINTDPNEDVFTSYMPFAMNPILTFKEYIIVPRLAAPIQANNKLNYDSTTLKKIEIKTNRISSFLNYPENYQKPIYGGKHSFFSLTKNDRENEFVISFPLDHDLYLYRNGMIEQKSVEGLIFNDFEEHYFDSFNAFKNPNYEEIKRKFWSSYSYGMLVFDPFREVYYREVKLPINNTSSLPEDALESNYRKYVFLIYDKDFNFLGKSDPIEGIDLTLGNGNYFFSEKGFHLFKTNQDNEDLMQFSTFKLEKNE